MTKPYNIKDITPKEEHSLAEPAMPYGSNIGMPKDVIIPYFANQRKNDAERHQQNRMAYFVCCINAFAEHYNLTEKQAFAYLHRFKGLDFLDECYEAEHQLSIRDAVNDLTIICKRNGGALV